MLCGCKTWVLGTTLCVGYIYQLGSMPFIYLSLPLGTIRPALQDFMPNFTRLEKQLMGISRHHTLAGRLILVNSVYLVVLTFYNCTLKLPIER
jgi:hypothetical protein